MSGHRFEPIPVIITTKVATQANPSPTNKSAMKAL
jgi:hypothetical protein